MSADEKNVHPDLGGGEGASTGLGRIEISDQVIAGIASQAAGKIEGVSVIGSSFRWSEFLGTPKESAMSKSGVSVKTDTESGHVEIDLDVNVEYGVTIYDVARQLQVMIKDEVEAMTGAMVVDKVNVRVRHMFLKSDLEASHPVTPDKALDQPMGEEEEEAR